VNFLICCGYPCVDWFPFFSHLFSLLFLFLLLSSLSSLLPITHPPQPEVLHTMCFSKTSDTWSFGILLYAMLSGSLPWPEGRQSDFLCDQNRIASTLDHAQTRFDNRIIDVSLKKYKRMKTWSTRFLTTHTNFSLSLYSLYSLLSLLSLSLSLSLYSLYSLSFSLYSLSLSTLSLSLCTLSLSLSVLSLSLSLYSLSFSYFASAWSLMLNNAVTWLHFCYIQHGI